MAWVSGAVFLFLMLANGFKVFLDGQWDTSSFLTSYIGIPIFLALYFGHRFTQGKGEPWAIALEDMDFQTGLDQVLAAEEPPTSSGRPFYGKFLAAFE